MPNTQVLAMILPFLLPVLLAAQDALDPECTVGTLEENCVTASEDNEFFFCTDRYSWEWSQDAEQLPRQASDSLCLTMDSNVIEGLEQTEILVLGGCDAEFQVVGGDCESLSTSTRSYDPAADGFTENVDMPTQRFRSAAVNVSEHVYLFGGRDAAGDLACNVDRYNVLTGEWTELDTQTENCFSDHAGVASDDGTIYLFGGFDQGYVSQTTVVKVEVSQDDTLTFSTSEPMITKRGDHSCVRLPATTEVFCVGGFTEEDWEFTILSSVERFDIETEQWESRAAMVNPRADFGAGLVNGRITVVGGEDEDGKPMDDVEWYDPETDCWTDSGELFDLPYKRLRYCAATAPTDGRIFIFGGQAVHEASSDTYSIEDTVNWYQEVLVGTLATGAASPSPSRTALAGAVAGFLPTVAISFFSALLLSLHRG